jgi:hypothetical protein
MGAPNIVRGGSHSGNVAASQLASLGLLDILSSDYYPASLLDAAFRVADDENNAFSLSHAIRLKPFKYRSGCRLLKPDSDHVMKKNNNIFCHVLSFQEGTGVYSC